MAEPPRRSGSPAGGLNGANLICDLLGTCLVDLASLAGRLPLRTDQQKLMTEI